MAKKVVKNEWILQDGRPSFVYSHPVKDPEGYGATISVNLARKIIKEFWTTRPGCDKGLGFTIGKDSLESILNQDDCVGIRFYLAKKNFGLTGRWSNGVTLVAIGIKPETRKDDIDGNEPEIGARNKYLSEDLYNIYEPSATEQLEQEGCIYEVLPPPITGPGGKKWMVFLQSLYENFIQLLDKK